MSVPETAIELIDLLAESNLIAPHHLAKLRAQVPKPDEPGHDARTFAAALIQKRVITAFQAKRLLRGRADGFFVGKYRILDLLGQGGMGRVYLAEQTTMKRPVALKLIQLEAQFQESSSILARFTREARAVARLRHPRITQAYDFDQYDNFQYIAMELVEGLTLHDLVLKVGPVRYGQAADFIAQAAAGLEHAQQNDLIHRDIKPGNLMVETSGSLKLLDLGLVGFHAKRSSSSLTMAGRDVILGTADYVSPEQALDSHGADIRSDIYSLGCVLYFLLTGAPPFAGKSAAEKLISHQTGTPKPIQKLAPDVPDELAKVLDRMMAKDPDDRFQTPQEVQEAVQPFAERVNPAYDPSLLRYTRESIDQLIRYGAEAINSSHRLTASMQGVSLRPEYGGSETSQSYASLSSGSVPISQPTTPNPAATIETVTHATMTPPQHSAPAPQPPVETPGDAPTPPPTQSAAPPKKSRWLAWMVCLLTVGGGITAGLTYYGPHHTRASDSLDPNETNKTKTIVLESHRPGVAIPLSFAQVQAGGRIHLKPRAEGWRHAGLTINGEQLPNGGHFTLAGEGRNVVLVKKSAEPLIRIRNAKRFTLENVTLDANGQSGPLIVIEGKAEGVTLKDLDLRNSIGDAIQFIGAQGNSSDPVKLSNVSVDAGSQGRDGLPIAFRSNALQDRSRNIEIVGCRLTHNAQTGILIGQPVENLMIRRCTIVGGPYGIRFTRSVTRSTSHGQVIRDWQTSDWQVADGKITTPEKSPKLNWQSRSVVEETVTIDPEKGKPYGFAHALFHSNREGARRLTFGCNVAFSVWVNDRKVLEHDGAQDYVAQAFTCVADFQKGTNHVVLRLRHEGRPAKFAVRVAEDASSLTLADWRNVTIDESVIEKARQSIVLMDVPTRQSKIQVQGTKFIDARHYPILVRLGETGLPPKVIEGIDNVDSEPHQARALTKDSVAYDLIPLQ